jgi:hypothetical protein
MLAQQEVGRKEKREKAEWLVPGAKWHSTGRRYTARGGIDLRYAGRWTSWSAQAKRKARGASQPELVGVQA